MPAPGAAVAPTLDVRSHLDGCPATRIERDEVIGAKGQVAIRTRCIDCGGQEVTRKDQ